MYLESNLHSLLYGQLIFVPFVRQRKQIFALFTSVVSASKNRKMSLDSTDSLIMLPVFLYKHNFHLFWSLFNLNSYFQDENAVSLQETHIWQEKRE